MGSRGLALMMTSLGLAATGYAFSQAFRSVVVVSTRHRLLWLALVAVVLLASLYGFFQAYRAVRHSRQS